ncbi:MAG: LytTR family DNA-binding domain-containing protein [Chitinophagales bacterium]|nr:LytTR family DNA-binding domain-containing protein [Chitinophagales bacterium]
MELLKAILVDDEWSSLQNLQQKIREFCPDVKIVAATQKPEEALSLIQQHRPDILFLDIEMPRMSGFRLLEELNDLEADIIFTTAYNHYAIDAIRISAFDYLVKPISVEELQNAVNRLARKHGQQVQEKLQVLRKSMQENKSQEDSIALPTRDGMEFVKIKNIVRIESNSNYSKLYFQDGHTMLVTRLLKDFEEMLLPYHFYRVHNSHLINMSYIKKYIRGEGGQVVMQNGDVIDVARRKKDEFLKLITS